YRGAGTFEFLYEDGEFFFIEMNTRIQVEHPITEMITGVDLVKEQLSIAAGNPLSIRQEDVVLTGHSFEVRVNAEHPEHFTPSPGTITHYHAPGGNGIRKDSHLYRGYTVPPFYDSLIAKIITWGPDRKTAFKRMQNALDEIVIEGIHSNVALHRVKIFRDKNFAAGGVDIHYLDKKLSKQLAHKPAALTTAGTHTAWLQLHYPTDQAQAEFVEELMLGLGAYSVSLTDSADEPIFEPPPGTTPLCRPVTITA